MELPSDMVTESRAGEYQLHLQRAGMPLIQTDQFISEGQLKNILNK